MYFKQKKKNQKKNQKKKESKNLSNNENESKSIDYDLFKKHFNFAVSSASAKQLYERKNRKKTMG